MVMMKMKQYTGYYYSARSDGLKLFEMKFNDLAEKKKRTKCKDCHAHAARVPPQRTKGCFMVKKEEERREESKAKC